MRLARALDIYYDGSSNRVVTSSHELGPLEMQVLGLLDATEARSVTDVQAKLVAAGSDLAYTTVMTVLSRLHKKHLVARRKDGHRFVYLTSKRMPGVSEGILTRVHRALFQGDRARPILALLEDNELSNDELRALRKAIDERLKGAKK